jgi:hypothetical protein
MTAFTITRNLYLTRDVPGFYHTTFGGVELPNNPNFLYKLKNDPHHNWSDYWVQQAQRELMRVLMIDLPEISNAVDEGALTTCVVPRAKADRTYRPNQLLFKQTVKDAVDELGTVLMMELISLFDTQIRERHTFVDPLTVL